MTKPFNVSTVEYTEWKDKISNVAKVQEIDFRAAEYLSWACAGFMLGPVAIAQVDGTQRTVEAKSFKSSDIAEIRDYFLAHPGCIYLYQVIFQPAQVIWQELNPDPKSHLPFVDLDRPAISPAGWLIRYAELSVRSEDELAKAKAEAEAIADKMIKAEAIADKMAEAQQ